MQIFSKNLRPDLLRMQGIISTSRNIIKTTHDQNLIFTQVSQHTLDCMHVKAGLNDLVEQMH